MFTRSKLTIPEERVPNNHGDPCVPDASPANALEALTRSAARQFRTVSASVVRPTLGPRVVPVFADREVPWVLASPLPPRFEESKLALWAEPQGMRPIRWVLALLLVAASAGAAAQPRPRSMVALLIANSAYSQVTSLSNPSRDVELVGAALRQAGFSTVAIQSDLGYRAFQDRLSEFQLLAEEADVALVYYAGHGVEVDGVNWLVPVDAQLASKSRLMWEAINLDHLLSAVAGAGALRIVILDACRNNPFPRLAEATRGGSNRGLAPIETSGYMVLFAAGAGDAAADGDPGQNSPFARALAEVIPQPGVELHYFPDLVSERTQELSPGQRPVMYGSIGGREMYFVPPANSPAESPQVEFDLFRRAEAAAIGGDCELLRAHRAAYPNSFTTAETDAVLAQAASCRQTNAPPDFLATLRAEDTARVTRADFVSVAERLAVEVEALQAVYQVESGRLGPFASDGRPNILFERHLFSRKTNSVYDASHPSVSNRTPGGYPRTQEERWAQLEEAYALDPEAALQSTSWGANQILGQNYSNLGMANAHEYVSLLARSERGQLDAFAGFLQAVGLVDELQRKDWAAFASRYNGPAYAQNRYDELMAQAYARLIAEREADPL